ncbi:MAG TPA: hypothetical protein VGK26_05990 [Thermoanaerobaculia bacterium]|jgi:hypothetical protein
MKAHQIFAIRFNRLPKVDNAPGLILLAIDTSNGASPPRRIGVLTDAALRSRLAHYDLHSANEVAAIRKALAQDRGQATTYEGWSGAGSCVQFWHDFVGSQIRPMDWTCEHCSALNQQNVGASVGEAFARACKCGKVKHITVTSRYGAPLS